MQEQSFCFNFKCNYIANEVLENCPQCGKKMKTSKQVKNLGWLQLCCGIFLVGLMGTITYKMAPLMLGLNKSENPITTFTGTSEQAMVFLGLFGLVLLFGLFSMISGIWHIKTGRRNKVMVFIILGLAGLLFMLAWLVRKKYGG